MELTGAGAADRIDWCEGEENNGNPACTKGEPRLKPAAGKKEFPGTGRDGDRFLPQALLLLFYCGLALLALLLYHYASHTVTLYVDGEELFTAHSFSRTVEEFLQERGIQLHPATGHTERGPCWTPHTH